MLFDNVSDKVTRLAAPEVLENIKRLADDAYEAGDRESCIAMISLLYAWYES